ncbi:OTU10, partial [Symbiodinium sp. CCMP2456]
QVPCLRGGGPPQLPCSSGRLPASPARSPGRSSSDGDSSAGVEEYQLTVFQQQTLDRLELVRLPIAQDGNCQFGAVARCVGMGGQEARQLAVDHIRSHRERFEGFILDETFGQFLQRLAVSGAWGDMCTLFALADALGIEIVAIQEEATIDVAPLRGPLHGKVHLVHFQERHFDATGSGHGHVPGTDVATSSLALLRTLVADSSGIHEDEEAEAGHSQLECCHAGCRGGSL